MDPLIAEDPQVKLGALDEMKRWSAGYCSTKKCTDKWFTLTFQISTLSRSPPTPSPWYQWKQSPLDGHTIATVTLRHKSVTLGLSTGTPKASQIHITILISCPRRLFWMPSTSSNTSWSLWHPNTLNKRKTREWREAIGLNNSLVDHQMYWDRTQYNCFVITLNIFICLLFVTGCMTQVKGFQYKII